MSPPLEMAKPLDVGGAGAPGETTEAGNLEAQDSTCSKNEQVRFDVITVIRDPKNPLGKRYWIEPDGELSKKAAVSVVFGLAVQHHIPDHAALAALLEAVAEDPNAAVINAGFKGIEIGEEFVILSEKRMREHLGKEARADLMGYHAYDYEGRQLKAICRFKENALPSAWQILDRDIDAFTPPEYAELGFDDWLQQVARILPGVDLVELLRVGSSSARVLRDGVPVSSGNGHTWIKVADPLDVARVQAAIIPRAELAGLAWAKPTFSRATGKELSASRACTLIDPAVWVVGRLVFCGKPTVAGGLVVVPQTFGRIAPLLEVTLDTAQATLGPDEVRAYRQHTRDAGREVVLRQGADGGFRADEYTLTLGFELDVQHHGVITVEAARDLLRQGGGKLRCQAPFRESKSWAGVVRLAENGDLCVHDVGTAATYWLDNATRQDELLEGFREEEQAEANQAVDAARRRAQQELAVAIGEGDTTKPPLTELVSLEEALERFVFVVEGGRVVDLKHPNFTLPFAEWKDQYAASKVDVGEGKKKAIAELWKASPKRKTVTTSTFKAGAGAFTVDPEGKAAINTWRRHVRPTNLSGADSRIDLFLDHMAFLFPVEAEREAFLDWLAHIEQRPGELPHAHWLHIATNTGMGRNWLASVLARVWPGTTAANFRLDLRSQFNGRLSRKTLAIVDEVREDASPNGVWAEYEHLKSMLTEETRAINPKYGRVSLEWNSCRFLMFSNHGGALPLTDTDRRFNVVRIDGAPKPPAYYIKLYAALDDPLFITAVADFLGKRDLSRFNPGARPIANKAREALLVFHQSDYDVAARELARDWPSDLITAAALSDKLTEDSRAGRENRSATLKVAKHSLERAGITRLGRKVSDRLRNHHRVWVVRNPDVWASALPDQLTAELHRGVGPDGFGVVEAL